MSLLLPFHVSADPLAAGLYLDKYARKITAAHHRAADTFCNFRIGVVRHDLISYERARTTGPRARQLSNSGGSDNDTPL